jgi:hypothetical protein
MIAYQLLQNPATLFDYSPQDGSEIEHLTRTQEPEARVWFKAEDVRAAGRKASESHDDADQWEGSLDGHH